MSRRPSRRVPVVVLSGHLGSGKTTLLNHLLRTSGGRIGVVVNDFGQVNVDALLVGGQVDATAISGGCLCCLADTSELDRALERLSRPALALDAIVVEASGLAEPRELARMVLASEVRGVRFGGVVEVVDAATWDAAAGQEPPVARDHLRVASVLVLSKVDRAARPVDEVVAALHAVAPGTPVLAVEHGRVDPGFLLDVAERPEPTGQLSLTDLLAEASHEHHHSTYSSVSVDGLGPVHPARLVDLLEHRDDGVYRVKGVLDVAGVGPVVVQQVGDWYGIERADLPTGSIVVIGAGLDDDAVRARLLALPAAGGEEPGTGERYAVERHLRR